MKIKIWNACTSTYQQKAPRSGGLLCGVEGSRTPVQTSLPLAFYMLISPFFVGASPGVNQPMKHLAVWSLNTVTAFCIRIRYFFESAAARGQRPTSAAAQMVT